MFKILSSKVIKDTNSIRFEVLKETNFVGFAKRDTVVADQRVSDGQNLAFVRWICKRFRIANHTSVEDDFSLGSAVGTEGGTGEGSSVFQDQVAL
jgi:hypothetical protein